MIMLMITALNSKIDFENCYYNICIFSIEIIMLEWSIGSDSRLLDIHYL